MNWWISKCLAVLSIIDFVKLLGRGLSIQLDPDGNEATNEQEEVNPEEDILFTKNTSTPVSHFHGSYQLCQNWMTVKSKNFINY